MIPHLIGACRGSRGTVKQPPRILSEGRRVERARLSQSPPASSQALPSAPPSHLFGCRLPQRPLRRTSPRRSVHEYDCGLLFPATPLHDAISWRVSRQPWRNLADAPARGAGVPRDVQDHSLPVAPNPSWRNSRQTHSAQNRAPQGVPVRSWPMGQCHQSSSGRAAGLYPARSRSEPGGWLRSPTVAPLTSAAQAVSIFAMPPCKRRGDSPIARRSERTRRAARIGLVAWPNHRKMAGCPRPSTSRKGRPPARAGNVAQVPA